MADQVLVVGRLERSGAPFQHSLSLTIALDGVSESVLVYGADLLIDVEVDTLARVVEAGRG